MTQRALSFGTVSEDYDRFRPGPPAAAVDWLLPPDARSVVDVGAGTGALTTLLAGRVARVTAVEPDERMRAVLARRVPAAAVLAGTAEELPLDDAGQDAVLASSAWHWVDPERAVPEAARVLRPGGTLGVAWTDMDREIAWIDDLQRTIRRSWRRPPPAATAAHGGWSSRTAPSPRSRRPRVRTSSASPIASRARRSSAWRGPTAR
jgi:ubiquinone/menaquinone biosynthesis C-methylase UbiE